MPLTIGVLGLTGEVSRLVVEAVARTHDLVLAGGTLHFGSTKTPSAGVDVFPDVAALAGKCDVVVDFTHGAATQSHASALMEGKSAWVLGTSGFSPEAWRAVEQAAKRIPVVFAANFAPGMNLVLALAEQLGAALPGQFYDAEIVDIYHRRKVDAPSGTALAIGRAVAAGRRGSFDDMIESGRRGNTGARKIGAIGFSALRGGQVVGENSLSFTSSAEQTTLTHKVVDRRTYSDGALRAARWVHGKPPGLYGMKDVLGLPATRGLA